MKRPRTPLLFLISSMFLLAMLASCSDSSSLEGGDRAVTLITADGEVSQPEPPPPEFLDTLLAETEGNPTAREEAILEALQLMLGEVETPYSEETTFDLGWMFSSIASGVYDESKNADFKAGFEELMARVFPVEERMLPYAAEDDASASVVHTALAANPKFQELDCRAIRARGFPARGSGDPPICQLYRQFIAGGQKFSVWFPVENRGDASFMAYVDAAVQALMDSQATYSVYSDVPGVNLVFTTLANPTNARVWASVPFKWLSVDGEAGTSHCPISVFPRATTLPVDDFKQTIAHEMFHCVTYLRRPTTFSETADWYMEGMAEHFSNVVYPENNFEIRKHLYYLDSLSPTDSFLSFKYTSWIFFQYLENEYGNGYNFALLDGLPASGSLSDQARAMAAFDDMQTIFHEFGQAYLNQEIMDSSGDPIPNTVYYLRDLDYDVRDGATLTLFSETMVLSRYRLQFGDGQEYDLMKDFFGQDGKLTWRLEDEEAFRDVPDDVSPQCGDPENYVMLFTSLTPDGSYGGTADLDMEVQKAENGGMDCCLVGTWEQLASENRSNLESTIPSDLEVVSMSGRAVLVITEERTTYFAPEDYAVTVRDPDDNLVTLTIEGAANGTFILPDDQEGVIESTGEEAAFIETLIGEGGAVSVPIDFPGFLAAGLSFGYECSAASLTSFPGELAPFSSSTYNRVSEVPQTPQPPEDLPAPPSAGEEDPSDLAGPEACQDIAITNFTAGVGSASWTVSNSGTEVFEIVRVSLDWPSENGAWQSASLDGAEFWAGSKPASPDILESFSGTETDRIVPAGNAALELGFSNDLLGSSGYILVLDFSNGCLTADVR